MSEKLRVYKTDWNTWAVENGDYYCEFMTFQDAVTEAHRVYNAVEWTGWWTGDGGFCSNCGEPFHNV